MRTRWAAILALTFLLCTGTTVAEPLRILALQYPPYVYDHQGNPQGLAVKVVQTLFRNLEIPIRIEILPWGRSLRYMEAEQADAVFNLLKTANREAYLHYLEEPLFEERMAVYARQPLPFSGDLAELRPYGVSVARAFSYGPKIDRALQQDIFREVITVNDYAATFKLLAKDRADILFSDELSAKYYKAQLKNGELIRRIGPILDRTHSYLAFSKKHQGSGLFTRVNDEIIRLKATGEYRRLISDFDYP